LSDPDWQCPSCRNICGCRTCRKKPEYRPYIPSGTVLSHDTKIVADPRSVESLVDFGYSNIGWIQKAGDDNGDNTRRLKQRRKEADAALANEVAILPGEDYADDNDEVVDGILRLAEQEGIPIDPALGSAAVLFDHQPEDEEVFDEHPEGARRIDESSPDNTPWVPEGGVIRDVEHAYDPTEAITYDYPDPEIGRHLAVPSEEEPKAAPPGHAPPVVEEVAEIEMVERKRKRKLDDGDRPYNSKRADPGKSKKQRKSLIVKLPVAKERLTEVDQMANMARQALNGVREAPAPVISSDLQALNAAEGNPQQVPKRIRNVEHVVVDRDDEFTPGRYRDRRKLTANGTPRPPPDAEITRRTTRMQNPRYEEPDEEEFNDVLPKPSERRSTSATHVVRLDEDFDSDTGSEQSEQGEGGSDGSASSLPVGIAPDPTLQTEATRAQPIVSHKATAVSDNPVSRTHSVTSSVEPPPTKPAGKRPVLTTSKTSKTLEEAQANRRAKMAAIEWMENDLDDFDDSWSQGSFLDEAAPAPKQSLQSAKPMVEPVVQNGQKKAVPIPRPAEPVAAKVSAAAWVDSDSDDEPAIRKPAPGWASVNANTGTPGPVPKADTPKRRGRPPKNSV